MTNAPPALRKSRAGILSKLLLSLLPAAVFAWLMQSGSLHIVPPKEELARVASGTIPLYIAVWCTMYFVRLSRWYWLLAPVQRVPFGAVLRCGSVGLFAVALLPFRMGEVVRPLLIRRPPRLTFWAASGTVGGERVVDALCVSVTLLAALHFAVPLDPLPDHLGTLPLNVAIVPKAAFVSALVFASGIAVMGLFYFQRAWARRMTERVLGIVSVRFARWVAQKIEQMAEGLGFLAEPRNAVPFLLATVVYWVLNAATWWIIARGCGLGSIGFWGATATMGVVALGILFPATPGFFGPFQLATFAGLAMYLDPSVVMGRGSAYAFLAYVLPISMSFLVGLVGMLANPKALLLLTSPTDDGASRSENLPGSDTAG